MGKKAFRIVAGQRNVRSSKLGDCGFDFCVAHHSSYNNLSFKKTDYQMSSMASFHTYTPRS